MPKALMLVYSHPSTPDREAEYNDWYDNVHISDVLKIPGIIAATRYKLATSPDEAPSPYVAAYEIETDDRESIMTNLRDARANGQMRMSDSITPGPIVFFDVITDRQCRH